ncbi:hypothetical protein BKA65DRAFT_566577 [Rhexocercosporidium sp. MPI-PUGE-AT-0058]|nr:hypothetical protein BKA65DRAFT_566577 [Rhexocercosporidium sp. MPI-PUGE-AT-0058]
MVNCLSTASTTDRVNYYNCSLLLISYGTTVEKFSILNSMILPDCSNTKPSRSTARRLCGPLHKSASSIGNSIGQCCNSVNWTCGNSISDCEPGTCWGGTCAGDSVHSIDRTCRTQHGDRLQCADKWGDYCNTSGKCGTGSSFYEKSVSSSSSTKSLTTTSKPSSTIGSVITTTSSEPTIKSGASTSKAISSTSKPTTASKTASSARPTCFNNVIAQYSTLVCTSLDPSCLCRNVNFGFGIRDSSNGACGTVVASTVIAFQSVYCSSAAATVKVKTTAIGIAALPSCGQTCFGNGIAQYFSLGCATPDPSANFGFGIRDCSNGACGTVSASTVIEYQAAYCSSAAAAAATRKSQ